MRPFLFLLLGATAFSQPSPPRPAPPLNLLNECKGKPTVLAFINTECSHCKAFTRDSMEMIHRLGLACTIAVAFDEDGDTAKFAREQQLTFPVYKIERARVREFLGLTGPDGIIGTPQVVVIDKHGVIQAQSKVEGSPVLMQYDILLGILTGMDRIEKYGRPH